MCAGKSAMDSAKPMRAGSMVIVTTEVTLVTRRCHVAGHCALVLQKGSWQCTKGEVAGLLVQEEYGGFYVGIAVVES